jgi:DNA helicase HerA-like ATPase/energy-coupling factor transporter ATP-binding protein EcfA2
MSQNDPRLDAFLSDRTEVFHSVQHRHEIWRPDPFDVDSVHRDAREAYERLLSRAATPPGLDSGRILLLLGESGCGKTHLIRAFRALTHERALGFVGYMQMTTATSSYSRYVLANLIDSLDQPYDESSSASGLMKLSGALLARCGKAAAQLSESDTEMTDVHRLVEGAADSLIVQPQLQHLDLDLLRALLYLQRNDPRIRSRLLKYLRCEDLSEGDRRVLGGLVPRTGEEAPQRMVEQFGWLMKALGRSLVLCVDQLEDFVTSEGLEQAEPAFRRALQTLSSLASQVPSSVIVISCLEDFWRVMRDKLSSSLLDRIERDPDPLRLSSPRTAEEARSIASRRLAHLYEVEGAPFDEQDPTWPFPSEGFERLARMRVRDVLDQCRRWREQAIRQGRLLERFPLGTEGHAQERVQTPQQATQALDQQWNDLRVTYKGLLPEDDESLAELLAWAIRTGPEELDSGHQFKVQVSGDTLTVDVEPHGARLLVALCNRHPQGGGFGRQLKSAQEAAQGRTLVIVRNSEFPNNPASKVTEQIGQILSAGGRRAVFGDSDFRTLLALRDFRRQYESRPDLTTWLRSERPLTQLRALRDILELDHLRHLPRQEHTTKPQVPPPQVEQRIERPTTVVIEEKKLPQPLKRSPLLIGKGDGLAGEPVHIDPSELTQHSAFLGGPGSGKTTLALSLIEQLLVQGVPALLIDRKGDLASYASESFWTEPLGDKALEERRALMRERVEVALFTPGHPHGRPLSLSLVPEGLASLEPFDREQATRYSAEALAGMMNLRSAGQDQSLRVILRQAVDLLVQILPEGEISLSKLTDFVFKRDPRLVNALGRLDTKLFERLVRSLETLRLDASTLMNTGGEKLDLDMLLGRGAHARPGRTRLSIISTRFLGDNTRILFWVSQLLIEAGRWIGRHPSPTLQAVVLFDEADLYLPAMRQPATKEPMENLLRRARSAGLGLMLATQTPGDLDYKCRDNIRNWFVGRVKERTSLEKMKPMLAEARVDFTARIPGQGTGEFHVMRAGQVEAVKAARAAMSTQQLSEEEILQLAARTRPQAPQAA